ncbi:MAG: hypothetical protein JEZ11_25570 [Desulfobacterales bacterium]|nr:hypothetical protein [Desulfobacterales bacterium]
MWETLFWIYLTNATFLLVHEMDSAYWKEWELFHLPGGPGFFMALHLPIVFLALWGVRQIVLHQTAGAVIALVLGASGAIGFGLHTFFIRTGHPEFKTPVSLALIGGMLISSLAQIVVAVRVLIG